MYRKKEIIFIVCLLLIIFLGIFMNKKKVKIEDNIISPNEQIVIEIDGEVRERRTIYYTKSLTYGALFIRIKNILNEYSDISSFDLLKVINQSISITIPTTDKNNNAQVNNKININTATKEELKTLPQIGDKRSEKIIEYIKKYGSITTWEKFFEIASIPNTAKEQIKEQAIL